MTSLAKPPVGASDAAADKLRPWLLATVVALTVARPLLPSEGTIASSDALVFDLVPLAVAAIWMVRIVARRGGMARYGAVDAAVVVLVAWQAVSALVAMRTAAPRPAVNAAWQSVALATTFFLIRQLIESAREIRAVAAVMISLAVAMSAYGFHQFFYSIPRDQARFAADPEAALQEARAVAPPSSRARELFEQRVNSSEPMATFALANSLAGFLVAWLTVSLGICAAACALRARDPRLWLWLPAVACALVILACLILTKSRAAFVATAVGSVSLAAWTIVRGGLATGRVLAVAVTVVALIAAAAIGTGALDREVLTEAGKSLGYRLQYWQATWAMIQDHPWLGCGPGQFQTYYTRYRLPEASETVADPHDFLLEVWATAGTPAAIALIAVMALAAWRVTRPSADAVESEAQYDRSPNDRARSDRPRGKTSSAQSPGVSADGSDAAWHIIAGGAAGFLLAFLLGPLAVVALGPTACVGGLLVAGVAGAALWPWVVHGRLPAFVPAVAAVVLLVNLLAAGGISFAGVAGSLWLLAALYLASVEGRRRLPRLAAAIALLVLVTLIGSFYTTVYAPVMACNLELNRADVEPERAEALFRAAAVADPLSAEPHSRLAMLECLRWQQRPSQETFDRFLAYIDGAQRLDPNSAPLAELKGDICLDVHRKTASEPALRLAIEAYERAARLHPNYILGRAKLARALAEAGDASSAAGEAAEALRLHALTPHADQKLPAEIIARMRALAE